MKRTEYACGGGKVKQPPLYVVKWYEDEGGHIWHETTYRNLKEANEHYDYLLAGGRVYRVTLRQVFQ